MEYVTLCLDRETGRPLFVDREGGVAHSAPDGAVIKMDYVHPYVVKYVEEEDATLVTRLPLTSMMPVQKIKSMSTGSLEEFVVAIGFCDPDYCPDELTCCLWMKFRGGAMEMHEFVYGGPDLVVKFPMSWWMGAEKKNAGRPESVVSVTQAASGIKFRRNSHVTTWERIQDRSEMGKGIYFLLQN